MAVANQNEAYRELEKDIAGRLSLCQIELTDFMKKSIKRDIKKYAIAISDNIDARFPQNAQKVLEAFSVLIYIYCHLTPQRPALLCMVSVK